MMQSMEDNYRGLWILSFEVCNKRKDNNLNKYSFYVSGFEKDSSTAHGIGNVTNPGEATAFSGDFIIAPGGCRTLDWGGFRKFNRYEVSHVRGKWEERSAQLE
jgi:hypothetical protein